MKYAPLAIGALTLAVIAGIVVVNVNRVGTVETHTECVVQSKEDRAVAALSKRDPRVTTSCGVFVVTDEILRFHFSAADVDAALIPGETVDLKTIGWRAPFLLMFPNVIEVTR